MVDSPSLSLPTCSYICNAPAQHETGTEMVSFGIVFLTNAQLKSLAAIFNQSNLQLCRASHLSCDKLPQADLASFDASSMVGKCGCRGVSA